jgi:glycyl-radical enzyme activating protein
MNEQTGGIVFDIKKFAIHDGPGIRTTVFLKGCPLSCLWCHNPESREDGIEISFIPDKCIGCGYCFRVCPAGAHVMKDGVHVLDRTLCVRCGKCAEECYAKALEVVGMRMSVQEALAEVMKDKPFYDNSGGGMTISGGEPMDQPEFTLELLRAAKEEGLHTCLDTSGFAPLDEYERLMPYVDIFLYDIKETDPERHKEFVGVDNALIMENLRALDRKGAKTILRCPLVPGLNDRPEHLEAVGRLASELTNVLEVTIHPYHPLGKSKSRRIGKEYPLEDLEFAAKERAEEWRTAIRAYTEIPVK